MREHGEFVAGDKCPNARHIEGPSNDNYVAAFEWRQEMAKTHTVSRCPDCLRFRIWTPKEEAT